MLEGLKEDVINLEDAENYIFDPYFASGLEKLKVSESLSKFIYWTCELDNVKRIIPDAFKESCENIVEEIIGKLKKIGNSNDLNYILKNDGLVLEKKDSF